VDCFCAWRKSIAIREGRGDFRNNYQFYQLLGGRALVC
jgi:hypothetical protein